MMLSFRRAVVVVAAGVVTTGALTASVLTMSAHAGSAAQVNGVTCHIASGAKTACYLSESVAMPLSVAVSVTTQPAQSATVSWSASCSRNGNAAADAGSVTAMAPFQAKVPLPRTNGANCSVSANVTVSAQASLSAGFAYTQGRAVMLDMPEGANYSGQPQYALRCLADPGNNPALKAKVVVTGCEALFSQAWTFRNGELMHGRLCLTDPRNGGSRSKLIMYTCTGAADQIWTLGQASGAEAELVLKAHGGRLCLDDPKKSTRYGTQVIVYTCNNGVSQRWNLG
jgi:hypothetical protein